MGQEKRKREMRKWRKGTEPLKWESQGGPHLREWWGKNCWKQSFCGLSGNWHMLCFKVKHMRGKKKRDRSEIRALNSSKIYVDYLT